MMYKITSMVALLAFLACADAMPTKEDGAQVATVDPYETADAEDGLVAAPQHRRELFPILIKCAFHGCSAVSGRSRTGASRPAADSRAKPMMALGDIVKGPVKALEMLALNEDLQTVVHSDSYCTRRQAMARAAGLAAGLAMAQVKAPGYAAETKTVKMGADNGQLVFVPEEIKICKGDTVTWVNNKGGPHNVVFDEEAIPSGVSQESISMDGQLGEEGETFTKKFDTPGSYAYYCEPHRGAGMNGALTVE